MPTLRSTLILATSSFLVSYLSAADLGPAVADSIAGEFSGEITSVFNPNKPSGPKQRHPDGLPKPSAEKIDRLIQDLISDDAKTAREARKQLGRMGHAVPALFEKLVDSDWDLRAPVLEVLARMSDGRDYARLKLFIVTVTGFFLGATQQELFSDDATGIRSAHVNASDGVSLSIGQAHEHGRTRFSITWKGHERGSILVVSIDSKQDYESRSREMLPDATELFGIVLVRAIGETGSAALSIADAQAARFLGNGERLVTLLVIKEFDLHVVEGDRSVKGGMRVTRTQRIGFKDCTSDFQLVCTPENGEALSKVVLENLRALSVPVPEEAGLRTIVHHPQVKALLRITSAPRG